MCVMLCRWISELFCVVFRMILLNFFLVCRWFWVLMEIRKLFFCGSGLVLSCLVDIWMFCFCIVVIIFEVVRLWVVILLGFS